jgi:hypothetical protein
MPHADTHRAVAHKAIKSRDTTSRPRIFSGKFQPFFDEDFDKKAEVCPLRG